MSASDADGVSLWRNCESPSPRCLTRFLHPSDRRARHGVRARFGLETNPVLQDRLAFLVNHRALWTLGWLTWTAAAIAILYFYWTFADTHAVSRFAVLLTVAALGLTLLRNRSRLACWLV